MSISTTPFDLLDIHLISEDAQLTLSLIIIDGLKKKQVLFLY